MILSWTLILLAARVCAEETFSESASLRTLPDGRVASTFTFTTVLEGATPRNPRSLFSDPDESQHYTLFPLSLGQILRQYAVTELHLTLNAGKWNYDTWGYPQESDVGTGATLWAWLADGAPGSIDERWQGLRNALSGLFCASIGALDEQRTTSPILAFAPEGSLPDWGVSHELKHVALPSEHVCTENLTPFLKLLPCKSRSGIASLLNPHRLFDANWHGMGVHVLWNPDVGVEVRMSFQSVSDPLRITSSRRQDWSFQSLFDRTIQRTCPVASSSLVSVGLPSKGLYTIKPEPPLLGRDVALYDLRNISEPLDVRLKWQNAFEYSTNVPDTHSMPISFRRALHGHSQDRGHLSVTLKNHLDVPLQVLYLETMPWILQFYLHTLKVQVNGEHDHNAITLSNMTYIPPIPHSRPATFQSVLTLPAGSTIQVTIDVAKAFLRYTEHPPDAQRGWDLPPAVLIPLGSPRIYTPPLLVDLATPDFSMPYNVIIFSCSLIAFLFGTVFNLLTRKFVVVKMDVDGDEKEKNE